MKELIDDAIRKLEALSADLETNDATREEANSRITVLRTKSQESSLNAMSARDANLQTLMAHLDAVIGKAEQGGITEKVSGLKSVLTQARSTADTWKSEVEKVKVKIDELKDLS